MVRRLTGRQNLSTTDEEKKIAEDFRRQLQERFPTYEGDKGKANVTNWVRDNSAKLEEFISTLGPNARKELVDEVGVELENTPLPNPRDEPFTHRIVQELCIEVESACQKAGIPLRGGIAYGVSPTFDLNAEQHPVPTTETSVVELSAGFISFCSHLSKVMAMSLPHEVVEGSIKLSHVADEVLERIWSDTELKLLWLELFGAYAFGDGPMNVELRIIPYPHSITRMLLLRGFEQFAITHEYAHHVEAPGVKDSVGVGGDPDSPGQEIEADMFAIALCRYMEKGKEQPNIFLVSGAAPIVLLKCLDYVRRTRRIFAGKDASQETQSTHPETEERVSAFDFYDEGISPTQASAFQQMRHDVCSIIDSVWARLKPLYTRMYDDGLRMEDSPVAWLPGSADKR
jgi:hypothetical protein